MASSLTQRSAPFVIFASPFLVGLRQGTQPGGGRGLTMAERPEFRPAGLRAAAARISHGLSE